MNIINLTINPHSYFKHRYSGSHDYVGDDEEKQRINEMLKPLISSRFNKKELKIKIRNLSYFVSSLSWKYQTRHIIVMAMTYKIDYLLAKELVSVGLNPIHLKSDWRHFNATQE